MHHFKNASPEAEASTSTRKSTYLRYVYTKYRIVFAPARKPYRIGLLSTHKNGDFGAISVTEAKLRRADILSEESHIG